MDTFLIGLAGAASIFRTLGATGTAGNGCNGERSRSSWPSGVACAFRIAPVRTSVSTRRPLDAGGFAEREAVRILPSAARPDFFESALLLGRAGEGTDADRIGCQFICPKAPRTTVLGSSMGGREAVRDAVGRIDKTLDVSASALMLDRRPRSGPGTRMDEPDSNLSAKACIRGEGAERRGMRCPCCAEPEGDMVRYDQQQPQLTCNCEGQHMVGR